MENLTEKISDSEDSLSFPTIELSTRQNITDRSPSYFKRKIPNIDHKILRLYF